MSRVLSRVRPAPAPEVESPVVSEPVRKLTFVKNPRLSFYSMDRKTTSKLDDRRYGEMSWFDFLVHTELCTMNYDALAKSDEDQLAHLVRMLENMKVPATLKKPVEDVIPFVCEVKAKMQGRKRVIQGRFDVGVLEAIPRGKHPRLGFVPRDDRSSKNEPNRLENDRDMSLQSLDISHPVPPRRRCRTTRTTTRGT